MSLLFENRAIRVLSSWMMWKRLEWKDVVRQKILNRHKRCSKRVWESSSGGTTASSKRSMSNGKKKEPSDFNMSKVKSFSEDGACWLNRTVPEFHSQFTFKRMHTALLDMPHIQKKVLVSYVGSDKLIGRKVGQANSFQESGWPKRSVLRGCNALWKCTEMDCDVPVLCLDLSRKDTFTELNGLFMCTEIRRVLEPKTVQIWTVCFLSCLCSLTRLQDVLRRHEWRWYTQSTQHYSDCLWIKRNLTNSTLQSSPALGTELQSWRD